MLSSRPIAHQQAGAHRHRRTRIRNRPRACRHLRNRTSPLTRVSREGYDEGLNAPRPRAAERLRLLAALCGCTRYRSVSPLCERSRTRARARLIRTVSVDTAEPSAFSHEILSANPYAYLDDAPLEERRTRAVTLRRTARVDVDVDGASILDPAAIAEVAEESWPLVRDADELHDALLTLTVVPPRAAWQPWWEVLAAQGRATELHAGGTSFWTCAERLGLARLAFPASRAGVVQPPRARAHPPPHAWCVAARDRAGQHRRVRSLLIPLATRRPGVAPARHRRHAPCDPAARRLGDSGRGLGSNGPARARRGLQTRIPRPALLCGRRHVGPAFAAPRARRGRAAAPNSADETRADRAIRP